MWFFKTQVSTTLRRMVRCVLSVHFHPLFKKIFSFINKLDNSGPTNLINDRESLDVVSAPKDIKTYMSFWNSFYAARRM
jgi:hypothetical protein